MSGLSIDEITPASTIHDSFAEDGASSPQYDSLFPDADNSSDHSRQVTVEPEKKPAKKRKSWGQQLPEPKTNLPPR
jgi:hypothetical protein